MDNTATSNTNGDDPKSTVSARRAIEDKETDHAAGKGTPEDPITPDAVESSDDVEEVPCHFTKTAFSDGATTEAYEIKHGMDQFHAINDIQAKTGAHVRTTNIGEIAKNARTHIGDVYNIAYQSGTYRESGHKIGIEFSLGICTANIRADSQARLPCKLHTMYSSKKSAILSELLCHLGLYKPYAKTKSSKVQRLLFDLAHAFSSLNKVFAGLFVHVIEAHSECGLEDLLKHVRQEIVAKRSMEDSDDVGDLGAYCELLLQRHWDTHEKAGDKETVLSQRFKKPPEPIAEFSVTHGAIDTVIQYLQDGLEIPYWKIILDAFSMFRANKSSLGSDMVALTLNKLRLEVFSLRLELQRTLKEFTSSKQKEEFKGLLKGIDKRVDILHDFVDSTIASIEDDIDSCKKLSEATQKVDERHDSSGSNMSTEHDSSKNTWKHTTVLVFLMITTVILTFGFFVKGFAMAYSTGNTGSKEDPDYWNNISNSVAVIMGNMVMVYPLLNRYGWSAAYVTMWIWFLVGISSVAVSIAVYPVLNPCWSSLANLVATFAGFGATLSITLAEGQRAMAARTKISSGQIKDKVE